MKHYTSFVVFVLLSLAVLLPGSIIQAKENVQCPIPGGKMYAPVPGSYCVDYYSCAGSTPTIISCPGGWRFDSKSQGCASSAQVDCN
ncbi:hypothetical protein BDB00DRAFT_802094 [Zychaea mexicana]|uniref:uncharacterized protein n=1 Tax=Zychaea mexicana TaxID=64656 RepID=UPI0022FE5BB4|nr:uncharacterized protein BDB00DRAFT_802094 [Zychaea mexicana]KAI9497837.1 hypothetical protein BDB00DRAFT_802094 [Zychaea mexicana]